MARPARQVPRSTGVTESASRFATRATPLPPVPPGATATASGSNPTPTECTTSCVTGSISCSVSSPCVTTSSPASPAVYARADGRLPTVTGAPRWRLVRSTGVTVVPGSVTDAPVVTQATSSDAGAEPARWLQPASATPAVASTRASVAAARRRLSSAWTTMRSAAGARGAGRAVGRPPPPGVCFGPEVTGDAVLRVRHRGGPALRQLGQRRHQGVDVLRRGAQAAARSHGTGDHAAVPPPDRRPGLGHAPGVHTEQPEQVGVRAEAAVADADAVLRAEARRYERVVHARHRE